MDEHQFRCPVCLDLYTDPVSTPCGHNFCKACLEKHWDTTDVYRCPLCKQMFLKRPELRVNISFREVVDLFKNMTSCSVSGFESCKAKHGEVACDVCMGVKMRASKSCLVCMASYCDNHLEPHKTAAALSKHKLIEPVKNLEDRICQKHDKILELYCKKEETFICQLCAETDHSRHQVVTAEVASQQKMVQIKRREREVELMIQDRHKRIEGINRSRKETQENAQRQMEVSVQVFTALIEAINKTHESLMEEIEERHDAEQRRFERLIHELTQEIDELEKKSVRLQQLSQIEDQITMLQTFSEAFSLPETQNWAMIPVYEIDFLGYIRTSLKKARQFVNTEIRNQESVELQKMKKFADDISIDPSSAGSWLAVSEDGKEVRQSPKKYKLLAITLRSGESTFAAAAQGLTTGRHYWEVGVKEKSNWALGVASGTFIKGEAVAPCPKNGMWGINHRDGEQHFALMEEPFPLTLPSHPHRVGVFVDYEEGQVSFFNTEAKTCIFTFSKCNFTGNIYPVFDPCPSAEKREVAPLKLMIVEISKLQN